MNLMSFSLNYLNHFWQRSLPTKTANQASSYPQERETPQIKISDRAIAESTRQLQATYYLEHRTFL